MDSDKTVTNFLGKLQEEIKAAPKLYFQFEKLQTENQKWRDEELRLLRRIEQLIIGEGRLETENERMRDYLQNLYDGDGNIEFDELAQALTGKE